MKVSTNHLTVQANNQPYNQLQTNLAQPAKQHGCETTYHRNIYKLNNPRLSQLYILIYQVTSNVIRVAMVGYQPTIRNHQTKDKRKAQIGLGSTHHCCFIFVVCPGLEILMMFIVCGIIQFAFCDYWRSAGH